MKKRITILTFLLTVLVRGFAQDTITGVVSRVAVLAESLSGRFGCSLRHHPSVC